MQFSSTGNSSCFMDCHSWHKFFRHNRSHVHEITGLQENPRILPKSSRYSFSFRKIPTKRRGIHVNLKIKYRKRENSRKKGENLREDTRLPAKWRPRERERESACVEQCRGSFRPRSSRFIENQYGRHIEDVINF